jgi:hypothetical protein
MRKRKRIVRIQVGELGALISQREDKIKQMFGELITDIMKENDCTWAEAKQIYKFRQIDRQIKREMNLI